MKTILAFITISLATLLSGYSKAGGWFQDFMNRSSFEIQAGNAVYYRSEPLYYSAPPVMHYYQPARTTVIYREPVYYAPPGQACRTYYVPPNTMHYRYRGKYYR